jgi:hypothetical protein
MDSPHSPEPEIEKRLQELEAEQKRIKEVQAEASSGWTFGEQSGCLALVLVLLIYLGVFLWYMTEKNS